MIRALAHKLIFVDALSVHLSTQNNHAKQSDVQNRCLLVFVFVLFLKKGAVSTAKHIRDFARPFEDIRGGVSL